MKDLKKFSTSKKDDKDTNKELTTTEAKMVLK